VSDALLGDKRNFSVRIRLVPRNSIVHVKVASCVTGDHKAIASSSGGSEPACRGHRLLIQYVFTVFEGCEEPSLIDWCRCVSAVAPAPSVFELRGQTGISRLGDARNGICTGSAGHTLNLLHCG
jgi:hypothetical protein